MSRFLPTIASLLLLSVPLLVAQPGPPHHGGKAAKQQILDLENQWKTATLASDTATMDKLLSADYVGISWTGQVNTKTMQLDRTRNRTLTVSQFDVTDLKVKVVGPVAIVTALVAVDGTNDGANFKGEFRYTRVYQRLPSGAWQITNFEATRIPPMDRPDRPDRPHRPHPPQSGP